MDRVREEKGDEHTKQMQCSLKLISAQAPLEGFGLFKK